MIWELADWLVDRAVLGRSRQHYEHLLFFLFPLHYCTVRVCLTGLAQQRGTQRSGASFIKPEHGTRLECKLEYKEKERKPTLFSGNFMQWAMLNLGCSTSQLFVHRRVHFKKIPNIVNFISGRLRGHPASSHLYDFIINMLKLKIATKYCTILTLMAGVKWSALSRDQETNDLLSVREV